MLAQADVSTFIELVKVVGVPVAILCAVLLWMTRSLVPKLQDEAATARAQFQSEAATARTQFNGTVEKIVGEHKTALIKIGDDHKVAIQQVVDSCRDDRKATIAALERAYRPNNSASARLEGGTAG